MDHQWRTWLLIGATGFGGPAGQMAILHCEVVERHRWLEEDEFLAAMRLCTLLPGPEAQQLATYAGWRRGGIVGGLLAGSLFVLLVTALAWLHAAGETVPLIAAAFAGTRPAVVALRTPLAIAAVATLVWVACYVVVWAIGAAGGAGPAIARLFKETTLLSLRGAYAVVPWALDASVARGWLEPAERYDALAMGEATPGPLILVVAFIGFLAGWRTNPAGAAVVAAIVLLGLRLAAGAFFPRGTLEIVPLVVATASGCLLAWGRAIAPIVVLASAVLGAVLQARLGG